MVLIDLHCSDHRGRMNTILRWMMGQFLRRSSGSWRLRQMRRLIPIAKCMLFSAAFSWSNIVTRYYEGGVSSVYLWDLEDGGFAGVVLLKKSTRSSQLSFPLIDPCLVPPTAMTPATPYEPSGSWDSIHVFETAERGRQAHYKLTSTVMLQLVTRRGPDNEVAEGEKKPISRDTEKNGADSWKREGEVGLSGSMTRQVGSFRYGSLLSLEFVLADGARLAITRQLIPYHEHGQDD
jgi:F-actin capping protein, beta subunit